MASLSLLMPVYNESATVALAITETLGATYPVDSFELVVVDDGSSDGTSELLAVWQSNEAVKLVRHSENRGKGAALRTAIDHAGGDFVAIIDADREYDPRDVAQLLAPLLEGDAGAVFGTRAFDSHSSYSFWYVIGNKAVTLAANVLFNSWLSDIMTCHKAMRADTFRALELTSSGFDIEPEITAKLLAGGYAIHEVPISYQARSRAAGKKLTMRDGLRVIRTLLRLRVAHGARTTPDPPPSDVVATAVPGDGVSSPPPQGLRSGSR